MPRRPQPDNAHHTVVLVDIMPPHMDDDTMDTRMIELEELVYTYQSVVIIERVQRRAKPDYKTFIGSGKLQEIIDQMRLHKADLLIFGNALKPSQIYNVNEKLRTAGIKAQARDRIDLILKIFEKHAKTTEARLQIELASIKHMGPRIFGMGMELSRQTGGSGATGGRGIGETNTERMRRHLRIREQAIRDKLAQYAKTRSLHRDGRKKKGYTTVGIVGYTNAGKSTLLNTLTNKGSLAADKLFATLGTRVGKLYIPPHDPANYKGTELLLNDTIGFIRDLPPQLIDAFTSTLEDSIYSDFLLHVVDASDPHIIEKIQIVEDILAQIGANQPRLLVCNKIDMVTPDQRNHLTSTLHDHNPLFVSAYTSDGIPALIQKIKTMIHDIHNT